MQNQGNIGITKNDTARDRFCATWAERSRISYDTKLLLGVIDDDAEQKAISTRKETVPKRMKLDEDTVQKLISQFKRFNVFKIDPEVQEAVQDDEKAPIDT